MDEDQTSVLSFGEVGDGDVSSFDDEGDFVGLENPWTMRRRRVVKPVEVDEAHGRGPGRCAVF